MCLVTLLTSRTIDTAWTCIIFKSASPYFHDTFYQYMSRLRTFNQHIQGNLFQTPYTWTPTFIAVDVQQFPTSMCRRLIFGVIMSRGFGERMCIII